VCRIVIYGQAGDDRLIFSNKVITAGELYGGAGNDRVYGGQGDDFLFGGDGDDVLFGDAGDDVLDGGPGDDRMDGGPGDDTLANFEGDSAASRAIAFSRWTNVDNPYDVTADGLVSALDALVIINYLNQFATGTQPIPEPDTFYPDINGDYVVSPLDVLWAINHLNLMTTGEGEGGLVGSSAAQAGMSQQIASLTIPPGPLPSTGPSPPLAVLPAGVRLLDVAWSSDRSASPAVDDVWAHFAGPTPDARSSAPQLTLLADAKAVCEGREQWPQRPTALAGTGLGSDELASVLDEIAADVAQGWQGGQPRPVSRPAG
jgi:hypothetical protein